MTTMCYEFRVDGCMSELARAAFIGMRITEARPETIVFGEVLDESHLYGIIAQFQTLGISLVSVHPVPA